MALPPVWGVVQRDRLIGLAAGPGSRLAALPGKAPKMGNRVCVFFWPAPERSTGCDDEIRVISPYQTHPRVGRYRIELRE